MRNDLARQVRCILVSPGKVSLGEILACGVAYANGMVVPIKRKEASSTELTDRRVLVLGIGRRYDPASANFDLHEEGKSIPSFVTLGKHLGTEFPSVWFDVLAKYEARGPAAFGNGEDIKGAFDNPLLKMVCREWGNPFKRVLMAFRLAAILVKELADYQRFAQLAKVIEVAGVSVGDFTTVPQELMYMRTSFVNKNKLDCTVSVNRNALAFCGFENGRLDFRQCEGKAYVGFIHSNGNYLATRENDHSIVECVVRDAIKEK